MVMNKSDSDQKAQKAEGKLKALEYEFVEKHLELYKKKLDKMSDSEINEIVLDRIVESLGEKKRLTKTSFQQQVIAFIGKEYWEKNEKDLNLFFNTNTEI